MLGLALGAVARGWMRLLSTDPEFSWNGTIFIVMAFTSAGLGHAVAAVSRRGRRRWSTSGRVLGAILVLPMFFGAGGIMLPTVVAGSLAVWRRGWSGRIRVAVAALAVPSLAFVLSDTVDGGLNRQRVLGLVLLAATYAAVVWAMWPIAAPVGDGWRIGRRTRAVLIGASVLAGATLLVGTTGIRA
jgi:hypothetical protein